MNENNSEFPEQESNDITNEITEATEDAEKKPEEKSSEEAASEKKKPEKKKKSWQREVWEWVYTLAIALTVAVLIKVFVFDIVKVDGSSMEQTLHDNDRLIVTKLGYKPKQGDIIILDSAYKTREKEFKKLAEEKGKENLNLLDRWFADLGKTVTPKRYYVKRVIALPGQTVDIVDGSVYVDGTKLDEPYVYVTNGRNKETHTTDATVEFPQTVEDNCVFVMGDHRDASRDSRSSDLGQVPYEAILGKAQFRIWPLNSIGPVK